MMESEKPRLLSVKRLLPVLVAGLLAVFLLLYFHSYHGIRHDSTLYLGQALLRWKPEIFGQDLFFAFGSQADFTIFPRLIAWLFDYFGPAEIFLALTLAGLFMFLLASWFLLRQLFPAPYRYWGLLALLILPSHYGGNGVFSYAEPFLTGRTFAEPLILAALATWWRARRGLAAGLWVFAASIHLLQALPALLLFWIDLVQKDKRWLHLLWLAIPAFAAASLEISPFSRWLSPYDAEWLAWIEDVNGHCFITRWRPADWCYLAFDLYLAGLMLRYSSGILRASVRTVLLATVCGILASFILVDIFHLVLPAMLQLWRTHWLLHWFAMACIPWLIAYQYREVGKASIRLLLFAAIIALGMPVGPNPLAPYAVLLLIPLHFAWPWLQEKINPALRRLFGLAVLIAMLLGLSKLLLTIADIQSHFPDTRSVFRPEAVLFSHPLLAGGLLVMAFILWQRKPVFHHALMGVLIVLVGYAGTSWDRRNPWTLRIESAQQAHNVFNVNLERNTQVFWDGELLAPWLILNRPSYINNQQNAGLLFNRGTAEEAWRRIGSMHIFNFQSELCQVVNAFGNDTESCVPDDEAVAEICKSSRGQLGYVVLKGKLKTPAYGTWLISGGIRGDRAITYRLYRCEDLERLQWSADKS